MTASAADGQTAQIYARIAGLLVLISLVAGGFGEAYVPAALVVHRDAGATATNIVSSESLFRLGFSAYLVEALCDTGLTCLFYLLLRGVRKDLMLLAAFFRLIGTAVFATAEGFYFAMLAVAGNADLLKAFSAEQRHDLAMLSLTFSGHGQSLATLFYGAGSILLGYLMYRSDFIPRFVGMVFAASGLGFVVKAVTWVLAPAYSSSLLLLPVGAAALILGLWLLVKGIDTAAWEKTADE